MMIFCLTGAVRPLYVTYNLQISAMVRLTWICSLCGVLRPKDVGEEENFRKEKT